MWLARLLVFVFGPNDDVLPARTRWLFRLVIAALVFLVLVQWSPLVRSWL
jgi:hypothetical protein